MMLRYRPQDYEGESVHQIKILHEDSEQQYKEDLANIYKLAKDEPDGTIRMKLFNSYWDLKRYFAGVSYNYAITAHRSQGSTFQYALVVMEDIYSRSSMIKTKDRNRIGYTACTRPKDLLVMLGDL